jgi:sterol 3beta-glucosyltransferase
MNVAIISPGSRGDVQPYLALGGGLKQAGHAVRILA